MKLLDPKTIKLAKDKEFERDIARIETTRKTLVDIQAQLNEAEAKFSMSLMQQNLQYTAMETEAIRKIDLLNKEIKDLEVKRDNMLVPIQEEKKRAYDLIKSAEETYADAKKKLHEANQKLEYNEGLMVSLEGKIDSLTDREEDARIKSQQLKIREQALASDRLMIQKLSDQLLTKLKEL